MAKTAGTQTNVGIGIESTAGTAVSAQIYPKLTEFSLQAVSEKELFRASRGNRAAASNSMIKQKFARGSIGFIANVEIMPYILRLALGGTVSTALAGGESAVWEHTINEQNTNASMKTATIIVEDGAIVTERFTNCIVNSMNIEFRDSYVEVSAEFIGQYPDTSSISEAYTEETELAYHQATAKYGTSISNAEAGSATALRSLSLNINNNILLDEAFLSGSNEISDGCLIPGRREITGSYSLHYENTTELNKYKDNTKNALSISLQGASIGNAETEEIIIRLARLVLNGVPKEYNFDGLIVLNQEFEVEYNGTEGYQIQSIVTNEEENSASGTYK